MMNIEITIADLASKYGENLLRRMEARAEEMKSDDRSHRLIYTVLGVTEDEGELIDLYENKGRFLYRYAGAFLEEAVYLCLKEKHPDAGPAQVQNTFGQRPKRFGIDCLVGTDAFEIKWRDATTDGDHITKEHTRIKVIRAHGLNPVRLMFYYPNRDQAIRIQETIKTVYRGVGGECYMGEAAWHYVHDRTGIDLKAILIDIAEQNRRR